MNVLIQTEEGVMMRHYDKSCQGNFLAMEPGEDLSNKSPFRVQNACGIIFIIGHFYLHHLWKKTKSIFGKVYKLYTIAGNFLKQEKKIMFKGATEPALIEKILSIVALPDYKCHIQLFVASIGIGRCLRVEPGCLLEKRLQQYQWIRCLHRIEEICSVVVFYVVNWNLMCEHLRFKSKIQIPKSITISVTRRGTLTLRLTWKDPCLWQSNNEYQSLCENLAAFVRMLV